MCSVLRGARNEGEENSEAAEKALKARSSETAVKSALDAERLKLKV